MAVVERSRKKLTFYRDNSVLRFLGFLFLFVHLGIKFMQFLNISYSMVPLNILNLKHNYYTSWLNFRCFLKNMAGSNCYKLEFATDKFIV